MATDMLTFALSFFFVAAIVYGSLEVSSVFRNKRVKGLISLVVGAFAAMNGQVSSIIITFMPYIIGLFMVFFILGFITSVFKRKGDKEKDYTMIAIVAILALFLALHFSEDYTKMFGLTSIGSENLLTIMGLAIAFVIFYAVYNKQSPKT